MLMAMDPASAALTDGSELTVDRTLACALATPLRSAGHRQVVTHNRRNRIIRERERNDRWARGDQSPPLRRSSTVKFANRSTSLSGVAPPLHGISSVRRL